MNKYVLMENSEIIGVINSDNEFSVDNLCEFFGVEKKARMFAIKVTSDTIEEAKNIKRFIFKYGAYIPNLRKIYLDMCGLYNFYTIASDRYKHKIMENCFSILEI